MFFLHSDLFPSALSGVSSGCLRCQVTLVHPCLLPVLISSVTCFILKVLLLLTFFHCLQGDPSFAQILMKGQSFERDVYKPTNSLLDLGPVPASYIPASLLSIPAPELTSLRPTSSSPDQVPFHLTLGLLAPCPPWETLG